MPSGDISCFGEDACGCQAIAELHAKNQLFKPREGPTELIVTNEATTFGFLKRAGDRINGIIRFLSHHSTYGRL
jgi:hypothetical protein